MYQTILHRNHEDYFIIKQHLSLVMNIASNSLALPKKYLLKSKNTEVFLREFVESLGPAYVKIVQCLSTRTDLFPDHVLSEMKKLQSDVKPERSRVMKSVLEKNLRGNVDEFFSEFEWTPIGCGSVSQVYKARLHSGELVAVKVVRPDVHLKLKANFSQIKKAIYLVELFNKKFRSLGISKIASELEELLMTQTNLETEVENIEKFQALINQGCFSYLGRNIVTVPKVYADYCSNEIVVMEYIDAISPYEHHKLEFHSSDLVHSIDTLLDQMIFFNGTLHADLHPGNFFWNKEGQLVLIDFGLICELEHEQCQHLLTVFMALVDGYVEFSAHYLLKYFLESWDGHYLSDEQYKIAYDGLNKVISRHFLDSGGKPRFGQMFLEILNELSELKLSVISHYSKALMTLITIDGYMYYLDPSFDMLENMRRKQLELVEYNSVPVEVEKLVLGEHGTYSTAKFSNSDPQQAYLNIQQDIVATLNLPASSTVMDVGCGRGKLLNQLSEAGLNAFGITLSKFEKHICDSKNLTCHWSSWETFDLEDHGFGQLDGMTAIEMLPHLSSLHENKVGLGELRTKRFFQWAHGCLKPGARLYVQELVIDEELWSNPCNAELYKKVNDQLPFVGFSTLHQLRSSSEGIFEIESIMNDSNDLLPSYRFWKDGFTKNRSTIEDYSNDDVVRFLSQGIDMLLELSEIGLLKLYRVVYKSI